MVLWSNKHTVFWQTHGEVGCIAFVHPSLRTGEVIGGLWGFVEGEKEQSVSMGASWCYGQTSTQ
eukprot:1136784-Pelagomonas_calceolata.AAC.6